MGDQYWLIYVLIVVGVLAILALRSIVGRQLAHRKAVRTGSLERMMAHVAGHHIRREPYGMFGWFAKPFTIRNSQADSPLDAGMIEEEDLFL